MEQTDLILEFIKVNSNKFHEVDLKMKGGFIKRLYIHTGNDRKLFREINANTLFEGVELVLSVGAERIFG